MSLTRSFLKGMGLTEEQVGAIIDAHTETVNGLKADRDNYKATAEKLKDIEKNTMIFHKRTGKPDLTKNTRTMRTIKNQLMMRKN